MYFKIFLILFNLLYIKLIDTQTIKERDVCPTGGPIDAIQSFSDQTLWIVRQNWIWISKNGRIQQIIPISKQWPHSHQYFNDNIDSLIVEEGVSFLFKNNKFWIQTDFKGFIEEIDNYLPGVSKIEANLLLVDKSQLCWHQFKCRSLYIFQGHFLWSFNWYNFWHIDRRNRDPIDMKSININFPNRIDAAFAQNDYIFLIKDNIYFQIPIENFPLRISDQDLKRLSLFDDIIRCNPQSEDIIAQFSSINNEFAISNENFDTSVADYNQIEPKSLKNQTQMETQIVTQTIESLIPKELTSSLSSLYILDEEMVSPSINKTYRNIESIEKNSMTTKTSISLTSDSSMTTLSSTLNQKIFNEEKDSLKETNPENETKISILTETFNNLSSKTMTSRINENNITESLETETKINSTDFYLIDNYFGKSWSKSKSLVVDNESKQQHNTQSTSTSLIYEDMPLNDSFGTEYSVIERDDLLDKANNSTKVINNWVDINTTLISVTPNFWSTISHEIIETTTENLETIKTKNEIYETTEQTQEKDNTSTPTLSSDGLSLEIENKKDLNEKMIENYRLLSVTTVCIIVLIVGFAIIIALVISRMKSNRRTGYYLINEGFED